MLPHQWQARALSRNGNDITGTYPELADLAGFSPGGGSSETGRSSPRRPVAGRRSPGCNSACTSPSRQRRCSSRCRSSITFDLLHLDGHDFTDRPYAARRDLLAGLALGGEQVQVPFHFVDVDPKTVLQAADVARLEGVVAKRLTAPYRRGRR